MNNTHPSNLKVRRLTELPHIPQEEIGESVLYATANNKDYKIRSSTYVDVLVDVVQPEIEQVASTVAEAVATDVAEAEVQGLREDLVDVAFSGSYDDLIDKPTIPEVPVTSVAGKEGDVVLSRADVGLGNVDNTSDLNKPISLAVQAALASKLEMAEALAVAEDVSLANDMRVMGYLPPVPYASGLNVNDIKFTVSYNGDVYAPKPELVPFTAGAWNPAQWYVIQGDNNLRIDLADPTSGAALIGYGNTSVFAALNRLALPETNLLAGLTGISYGDVARVVNQRDGGYWKWLSGDVSGLVGSDPFGALWRAPASDPTGVSGAWERVIENGVFDAEWVLPDAMPANAQVRLQAMISALPPGTRRLLLPRRQVNVTGTVNLSKGIEYIGGGRDAPFDGGGASGFFPITVSASGARVVNVSSGNVTGAAEQGEPGGFHVTDGLGVMESDGLAIENVSFIDCHAYNARTGLRVGYKSTPSSTPGVAAIQGARDTYIENFTCEGIMRIGIETMRAHGVTIVGGNMRMAEDTFSSSGLKRGVRVVGAHGVTIQGLRVIGDYDQGNIGVSVEYAGNQGNYSGATDIICSGVTIENCTGGGFRVDEACGNVMIEGCRQIGWTESSPGTFLRIIAGSDPGLEARNVQVNNCVATFADTFIHSDGFVYGLRAEGNTFISNDGLAPRFFTSRGNATRDKLVGGIFRRNISITTGNGSGGVFRFQNMNVETDITIDGNEFAPDSLGNVFAFSGDGTVRMRRRDSNRVLPNSLWSVMKPTPGQEEYS